MSHFVDHGHSARIITRIRIPHSLFLLLFQQGKVGSEVLISSYTKHYEIIKLSPVTILDLSQALNDFMNDVESC